MNILETTYGRFHVYINYLLSEEENMAHLSFVDKNNKTHIVLMRQFNGKWLLVQPETLSHWIVNLEEQFDILITTELLRNYQPAIATAV
jgi:hypothetical protein